MDIGKVYVIQNTRSGLVKIGKSYNPQKRLKSLQSACGEKLELLYETIKLDNCGNIESKAHKIFKEDRRYGEWFNIVGFIAVETIKNLVFELQENKKKEGLKSKNTISPYSSKEMRIEPNILYKQRTRKYVVKVYSKGDLITKTFNDIESARIFKETFNLPL